MPRLPAIVIGLAVALALWLPAPARPSPVQQQTVQDNSHGYAVSVDGNAVAARPVKS